MRKGLLAVAILLTVCASTTAIAELNNAQKQAVKALIGQFSAKPFDVRQHAGDRLIEIGPDVLPIVRKTKEETADNEVKLRCQMVIEGIEKRYGVKATEAPKAPAAEPAKPTTLKDLDVSHITLNVTNQPLAGVLAKFAEQSGNDEIALAENLTNLPVTLNVKNMPYWQALDALCKSAGLMYQVQYRRQGQRFESGMQLLQAEKTSRTIDGYAGPAVIIVQSVVKRMDLRQPMARQAFQGAQRSGLTYQMFYYWENRLPVLDTSVEFTKAVAADGTDLLAQQHDNGRGAMWTGGRSYGMAGLTMGNAWLRLPSPAPEVRELGEVRGTLTMHFGVGKQEVRFDDVLNAEGKTLKSGIWSLEVKQVRNDRAGIRLTVTLRKDGKPVEDLATSRAQGYGVTLIDPNGRRDQTYYTGRAVAQAGVAAPGQNPAPPQNQAAGQHNFGFYRVDRNAEGAWSLVITLPEQETTKEYPFTLKNVPIP